MSSCSESDESGSVISGIGASTSETDSDTSDDVSTEEGFSDPKPFVIKACETTFPNKTSSTSGTRSFFLGFTTWKYAVSDISQTDIYNKAKSGNYGDIVGLHYMDGIPWDYGYDAYYHPDVLKPYYPQYVRDYVDGRIEGTAPVSNLYLAVDPINDKRNQITKNLITGSKPANFSDASADDAYSNFALFTLYEVYEYYTNQGYSLPFVYFNFGSEASDLILNESYINQSNGSIDSYITWDQYVGFINLVKTRLQNYSHPSNSAFNDFLSNKVKYMISVALKSPKDGTGGNLTRYENGKWIFNDRMEVVEAKISDIHTYIDLLGISTYGYIYYENQYTGKNSQNEDTDRGNPVLLPSNWLSQVSNFSGGKPIGITETGWIAEDYDVYMDGSYIITSDGNRQKLFAEMLLSEANALSSEFVIWFTLADYDPLWDTFGIDKQFGLTWLKTGLFDISPHTNASYQNQPCTLTSRPAWSTWSQWQSKSKI